MEVDESGPDSTSDQSRDEIIQADPERERQNAEYLVRAGEMKTHEAVKGMMGDVVLIERERKEEEQIQ